MKTIQTRIEEQVDVFVGNLQQLMRETAIEAVERATGANRRPRTRRQMSERRKPEEIAELSESLHRAICTDPGASMRTIGETVGRSPRELALCARRLIREGRVKKAGQRDQTRYFPVDAPAKAKRRRRTKR